MHPFRTAIEARDIDAAGAALADDVVFASPVVYKPYAGRNATQVVISLALQVFEDFAYTTELSSPDGRDHALVFRARVGGKDVEGCDFVHDAEDGRVDRLAVMVRPLSAALALREQMAALLPEAGAG